MIPRDPEYRKVRRDEGTYDEDQGGDIKPTPLTGVRSPEHNQ